MAFLLVGTGGVLGAWARYLLGQRIETHTLDTLAVNVLGSFALGVLLAVPETRPLSLLFAVGFCGAFTTFSTFAVETVRLVERGERRRALFNATINLFGTIVAVVAGGSITTVVV